MIIEGILLTGLPIKRFWRNAHAPWHVTQGKGVTNNHIFGIPDPYCLFTLQLSRSCAVIIKGSLLMGLPIIKRLWRIAHAPRHVTQGMGVANNHIFEIPDPILPIHFTTFRGLR